MNFDIYYMLYMLQRNSHSGLKVSDPIMYCIIDPQRVDPQRVDPQRVDPQRVDPQRVDPQ